ncbi:MAG TPA: hypothetical protein VID05_08220 [Acidimicrobiales bacterium]
MAGTPERHLHLAPADQPGPTPPEQPASSSIRSIGSTGSILSIGSAGSILSIGSAGSILSIGSAGSILSIGSAGSILSVLSLGSISSVRSVGAVRSVRSVRRDEAGPPSPWIPRLAEWLSADARRRMSWKGARSRLAS